MVLNLFFKRILEKIICPLEIFFSEVMKNKLLALNGSVQQIEEIPQDLKDLYKTVWEISQKKLIDMAADRGAFIDQSQSFNVHMRNVSRSKLTSMHFYGKTFFFLYYFGFTNSESPCFRQLFVSQIISLSIVWGEIVDIYIFSD